MTTTTTSASSPAPAFALRVSPFRLANATIAGGLLALALNLLIYFVVQGPLGIVLLIPSPAQAGTEVPLALGMVIAALLLLLFDRRSARPIRTFQVIASVFGLLSLAGPFALSLAWAVRLPLLAMHVCTTAAITLSLSMSGSRKTAL
ncbi:MAG: DUF6069 family protein [Spirochaetota bacterium]